MDYKTKVMWKVITVMLVLVSGTSQAQNWNEWVRQKKTQIRYLTQQVAALQVYIELGQEGYNIAHDGLQLISDVKNGEFDLHNGYFNSLVQVKSAIRKDSKALDAFGLELKIMQQVMAARKLLYSDDLQDGYIDYVNEVLNKFLKAERSNRQELNDLITDGHYSLRDDERLERIETLYQNFVNQYGFIKEFYHEVLTMFVARQGDRNEVEMIGRVFNLQNP